MLDVSLLKVKKGSPDKLYVRQATGEGYVEVCVNGVFDAAYPNSHTRRGRVQGGGKIAPTVTCSPELYVFLYE